MMFALLIGSAACSAYAQESTAEQLLKNAASDQNPNSLSSSTGFKQDIPYKKDESPFGIGFVVKLLFVFLFVTGLAYMAIMLLKKFNYGITTSPALSAKGSINILEVKRLTPKLIIFSLDVDGEKILLAQSGDNVSFYQSNYHSVEKISARNVKADSDSE